MSVDLVPGGPVLAGRYRVGVMLYRTPSSRVWEAYDPVLDRTVAVETLDPRCTPGARAAFRAGALRSAQCSHHGLVGVYDTGDDHGTAFVVTERVVGTPLDTVLTTNGALTLTDAAHLLCETADALGAAHASGLVHGAFRSSSITITATNRVKLGGFGAPATGDRYCAPEQRAGQPATPATDVFALGVCAVEMLTGLPFDPSSGPASQVLGPDIPRPVTTAIDRALEADPAQRAAHVRALHRAFAPLIRPPAAAPGVVAPAGPPAFATPEAATQVVRPVTEVLPVVPPTPAPTSPGAPAPTPEPFDPRPEPHTMRRRSLVLIALVTLGALVGIGALLLLNSSRAGFVSVPTTGAPQPVPLAQVTDFDPFGDNGREGAEIVSRAADGDPATAWSTEIYTTPAFGNAKPGVGLIAEPATTTPIRAVTLTTATGGWSAAVYARPTPGATLAEWGSPIATVSAADPTTTIELPATNPGEAVLVWFTRLPDSGQLKVSELQLLG